MCGICGQLRFDGEIVSTKSLDDMMSKLAKRGPDSKGKWFEGRVARRRRSNAQQPWTAGRSNGFLGSLRGQP